MGGLLKLLVILGLSITAFVISGNVRAANVANIGERTISEEDVRAEYEQISKEQREAINKDMVARRSIVENAVNIELLAQAAKKTGIDKDKDFKKAVERFERQYLATKFMEKSVETKLSSGGVKKFFQDNKNLFDSTQICAFHIVVEDQKAAEELTKQAKNKGASFEELAKKNSIDPTVQDNKGDLGCFTRERMVPSFADAAFTMKKNEIKGPVMTNYGYHVIKVYDVKPGKAPNFDEVEQRAKDTYRVRLMQELISDLRSKSGVKLNEEQVKKFKL